MCIFTSHPKVENNEQKASASWQCPKTTWVFGLLVSTEKPQPKDLDEQLNLGFAFTKALDVAVIPQEKKASKEKVEDSVLGAPAGSGALEKGPPPGTSVPAESKETKQQKPREKPKAKKVKAAAAAKTRAVSQAPGCSDRPAAAALQENVAGEAAKASAPGPGAKRRRIQVPDEFIGKLGCSKCNKNSEVGCTTCRPKHGLVEISKNVWAKKS